jgi:hypothetical protein
MVVPPNERYPGLKPALFDFVDQLAKIREDNPNLAEQSLFFTFLTFPWLAAAGTLTQEQIFHQERRKLEIEQLGFDGERAKRILDDILAKDQHLRECCPSPLHLATYFDAKFLTSSADAKRRGVPLSRLEFAFEAFESLTYQQRFRRIALSHLYNFDMEGDHAVIEGTEPLGDIRIERLNERAIPAILGESGFQAFLHPVGVGNCFVLEEESASHKDDLQWISEKRQKAWYFAQVLQYYKDGVVHLGYSVPVFFPEWAGQVRRSGVFFLGDLRRVPYENGNKAYFLDATAKEHLDLWWRAATAAPTIEALAYRKGKLRQATWRAGEYYESSHRRSDPVDRLIAIAIGFESLFSPSDQGELNFRICEAAAQFLGRSPAERQQIFSDLKRMYRRRSEIVHGTYDLEKYDSGQFVTPAELDAWAGYLRRAMAGFLALYLTGNRDAERDPILTRIAGVNFDESKRAKLSEDSDLEKVLRRLSTEP